MIERKIIVLSSEKQELKINFAKRTQINSPEERKMKDIPATQKVLNTKTNIMPKR